MGKSASNEELKTIASFLNALAAGVVITGVAVPTWALLTGAVTSHIGPSVVVVVALVTGIGLHRWARSCVRSIVD